MRIFKNVLTVTLASALVLAAFPADALAGSWSSPVNLSDAGHDAGYPQVTVDSTGLAIAVWNRYDGSNYVIQSSTSQSGGTWSPPVNVSVGGQDAYDPQVTVDISGLATAVWNRDNGNGDNIIQSSTSQSGAAWSTPVNVSLVGTDGYDAQITVDSSGLASAIWTREPTFESNFSIIQSSTRPLGGTWSTPVDLSLPGGNSENPQIAVDSSGLASAVWYRNFGFGGERIQSSTSQSGGAWTSPVTLSQVGFFANSPQLTVDSSGLATAIWSLNNGTNDVIQSSTSQSGGSWSTPVDVSLANGDAYDPQVTVDSSGLVTAVWHRWNGINDFIQSSTSQSGGSWSTPVDVSVAGSNSQEVQISVSSSGLAFAIWNNYDGNNYIAQSSNRPQGGTWSTPVNLSVSGHESYNQRVTVDSTGLATAVWMLEGSDDNVIQSSTFDNPIPPAPPTLAKTGVEVDWLALASLIAFVTGAGLFSLGRGRRTE